MRLAAPEWFDPGMLDASRFVVAERYAKSVAQLEAAVARPSRHFEWGEFACKCGCGRVVIHPPVLELVEDLRDIMGGRPILINSAYRCPDHNAAVGGKTKSTHQWGRAIDARMDNHNPHRFVASARELGARGIGTYPRQNFVHVDTGAQGQAKPLRRWGADFPAVQMDRFDGNDAGRSEEIDERSAGDAAVIGGGGAAATVGTAATDLDWMASAASTIKTMAPWMIGAIAALYLYRRRRLIYTKAISLWRRLEWPF